MSVLKKDRKLLHIHMPLATYDRLVYLMVTSDSGSLSETVRRALSLYDFMIEKKKVGAKIKITHKGKTKELEFV